MMHHLGWFCLAAALLAGMGQAGARASTAEQDERAIRRAIAYLYAAQHDGNWERGRGGGKGGRDYGGYTAIATYALLAARESHQDPRLKQAMEFLKKVDMQGIYALGLRCQVWHLLPSSPEMRELIKKDGKLLLDSIKTQGDAKGFYNYKVLEGPSGRTDHSNSQYGVLGLWACAQSGFEAPLATWKQFDEVWRADQLADGGWTYVGRSGKATASMTAAGVATLFITSDYIHAGAGLDCKGNIRDENIERGLTWMGEHFGQVTGRRSYYTLYGIERIGVASGYKYFGTTNWYADGADYLVRTQATDGAWGGVPDTCFAILFLVRGRAPVVMNKLEYGIDTAGDKPRPANWNERPRDAANVTRWISQQVERDLNWQIVNLRVPVEDLHDSPILYIAGNQSLSFSAADVAKLRAFVEQGGMILGHADCASVSFTSSFARLGKLLFPEYEFRELPVSHPIYTHQQFPRAGWKNPPSLRGLSNGVRELMLLLGREDPGKAWQTQSYGSRPELHQVMGNIYLYAVERRNLRNKGDTHIVRADSAVRTRGRLRIARLEHSGNWDPEPGGWRRLANLAHNQQQLDLCIEPVALGSGKLTKDHALAHLTGTARFRLQPAEQAELKKYIESGGTLLIDAAGGSTAFAAAAEDLVAAMFPAAGGPLPLLQPDHKVFSSSAKLDQVGYRQYARKLLGSIRTPRLRGLDIAGRTAVYLSPEDLSAGMVGQGVDGILGYDPKSATAIVANIVALCAGKAGATVAAPKSPVTAGKTARKTDRQDRPKRGKRAAPQP